MRISSRDCSRDLAACPHCILKTVEYSHTRSATAPCGCVLRPCQGFRTHKRQGDIMRSRTVFVSACIALATSGCNQQPPQKTEASIDQTNLCEVHAWRHDIVAGACKPGQKVAFLPPSFGNEQLPIIFAAVNCDLRYSVALTNGAVTCIYQPITPRPAPAAGASPDAPAKP
jgi:hypothetical protein